MQAHPLPAIPIAKGGPVTTRLLEFILPHARALSDGQAAEIDPAAGEVLVLCLPGIIEELIRRRRAMEVIQDMANLENVTFLHREEPADG